MVKNFDLLNELEEYADLYLEREAKTLIKIWIDDKRKESQDIHEDKDLEGRI